MNSRYIFVLAPTFLLSSSLTKNLMMSEDLIKFFW